MTTYTLAGGCFWCHDAIYRQLRGVSKVRSGYCGGTAEDANYYQVASETTGHAECVQVTFDETVLPKEVLLDIFFLTHNPTTLNQDGANQGTSYRSAMFYENNEQKTEFEAAIGRAKEHWDDPIITSLEPSKAFYEAEPEHQDYFNSNPTNPYCSVIIDPKITKARAAFSKYMK